MWVATNLPKVLALANYTLGLRRNGSAHAPAAARGMIWGPAEHDTCHYPNYYFSTSMWAWRGMVEFGGWLAEEEATQRHLVFAKELLIEAGAFNADLRAAFDASVVKNGTSGELFVPPVAGPEQPPFGSMIESTLASYSNFRYYSEMLSSGFMSAEEALALSAFRESHQGTLSGMTRFQDHLDDMPAEG